MAHTIGYVYRCDTYCNGECITERLIREDRLSPAARLMTSEQNLAALADVEALSAHEVRDSDTYPQAVDSRADDLVGESCAWCGGEIDPAAEQCA